MIERGKHIVAGVNVDALDYEAAVARVIDAALEERPLAVTALAVHGVMTGSDDPEHLYRLNRFDLVVPDGQPVRWSLALLHRVSLPDRVYGPTLTLRVCEAAEAKGIPIYLYGSRQEVLDSLVRRLKARFPQLKVAGATPSRFRSLTSGERDDSLALIRNSGARITFVGLGCPRQEIWCYENCQRLSMPVLAVGAAFDFHAGNLPQAPRFIQNVGLEWLFRLIQEPRRLWKRYMLLNPRFLLRIGAQALGFRLWKHEQRPDAELRIG